MAAMFALPVEDTGPILLRHPADPDCAGTIEKAVCRIPGVLWAGANFAAEELRATLLQLSLSQRSVDRLIGLYGSRARDVVAQAQDDKAALKVIHEPSGAIGAELIFAMKHEFARSLTDVLARRVLLAFQPGHCLESIDAIAKFVGERMGWTAKQRAGEIAEYRAWLSHLAVPRANAS